jgi:hypothetical protein
LYQAAWPRLDEIGGKCAPRVRIFVVLACLIPYNWLQGQLLSGTMRGRSSPTADFSVNAASSDLNLSHGSAVNKLGRSDPPAVTLDNQPPPSSAPVDKL